MFDYLAFMTNSQIQTAYSAAKKALSDLRLNSFTTVNLFKDRELMLFAVYEQYALTAQRSSIAQQHSRAAAQHCSITALQHHSSIGVAL